MRLVKWKRWSKARREEHRGRMWGHNVIQEAGAGQVKVQVGAGHVEKSGDGSIE